MMGRTDACVFSHVLKRCSAVMLELKGLVLRGLLGIQRPTEKIQRVQGGAEATVSTHLCLTLDNPQFIYAMGCFFLIGNYFKLGIGIASLPYFL